MTFTRGFISSVVRDLKFDKHVMRQKEFPFLTAVEYEIKADLFLGVPLDADTLECVRRNRDGSPGDRIRYNPRTEEFGVLAYDNFIRSYFKPDPNEHREKNNRDYFEKSCKDIRG